MPSYLPHKWGAVFPATLDARAPGVAPAGCFVFAASAANANGRGVARDGASVVGALAVEVAAMEAQDDMLSF